MTNYHCIIATERRQGDRATSIAIHEQLHSMGERISDVSSTNLLMVAEWDGIAPYVTVLKGDYHMINMAYAGWPMVVDQSEYEAQQAVLAEAARIAAEARAAAELLEIENALSTTDPV